MICRHCNQPLRQRTQGTKPARINGATVFTESTTLLDCQNEDCPLWMQTFDSAVYADKDLSAYLPNDEDTERFYPKGAA